MLCPHPKLSRQLQMPSREVYNILDSIAGNVGSTRMPHTRAACQVPGYQLPRACLVQNWCTDSGQRQHRLPWTAWHHSRSEHRLHPRHPGETHEVFELSIASRPDSWWSSSSIWCLPEQRHNDSSIPAAVCESSAQTLFTYSGTLGLQQL